VRGESVSFDAPGLAIIGEVARFAPAAVEVASLVAAIV